jgi:hypothetical protein
MVTGPKSKSKSKPKAKKAELVKLDQKVKAAVRERELKCQWRILRGLRKSLLSVAQWDWPL